MNPKLLLFLFAITIISCKTEEQFNAINDSKNSVPFSIAYPVSNISIDGAIEDWNVALPEYRISSLLENKIEGQEDLSAGFKVGFSSSEKSVYLAIIVTDDNHQVDDDAGSLSDSQDQCLIYLDKTHSPKGSGVNVYSFNELQRDGRCKYKLGPIG